VHESRYSEFQDSVELWDGLQSYRWQDFRAVKNTQRDCVVDQTNVAFFASDGYIITGAADDYYPPEHWDTLLIEAICGPANSRGEFPGIGALSEECMLLCSTGAGKERDRELMIGGAATRLVFERRGYLLDPDFESMFADNWCAFENRRDAQNGSLKIIERLDIAFDHRHPIFGKGKMDPVYALENREQAYRQGQATFMRKAYGTQVLYACCPGETFRAEWVWPMFSLLMYLNVGNRFMVAPIGGHTSNVYCTRIEMAEAALGSVPAPDFVLWMDDDNIVAPEQFDMLYQDLVDHPELSGVVGWCWCDNDGKPGPDGLPKPWMMSCGRQGPDLQCYRMSIDDFRKAQKSGTMLITSDDVEPHAFWSGFPVVLMRGDALRELGASAFAPILDKRAKYGFLSEDAAFFLNARKAGQKWAVDLRVKVPHGKFRAIEPQFLPESLKAEAMQAQGVAALSSAAD
jgi:hypothetical protein